MGAYEVFGEPIGYGSATVSTSAVALPARPANAYAAVISVETNTIRYRVDGTDPTSSEGHSVPASVGPDTYLRLWGPNTLLKCKLIRVSADATVRVTYYGGV